MKKISTQNRRPRACVVGRAIFEERFDEGLTFDLDLTDQKKAEAAMLFVMAENASSPLWTPIHLLT
jgi:hypothetical protein